MTDIAVRDASKDEENGGHVYLISKPIRLGQLEHEIVKAMKWRKYEGLSAKGDLANASPKHPVEVTVLREDGDDKTILAAIEAHTPDPDWKSPALSEA